MAQWLIIAISACWVIHAFLALWVTFALFDYRVKSIGPLATYIFLTFFPFTIFWWSWVAFG